MTKLQDYPNIPASSLTGDDKILVVRKNDQGLVKLSSLPANIPDDLKTEMNDVLNKKFKTSTTYPPAIWDDKVNLMAVCPEETVSGNVVTFVNGADDVPLKKCEVTFPASISGYSEAKVKHCKKNLFSDNSIQSILTSKLFEITLPAGDYTMAFDFVSTTAENTPQYLQCAYNLEDGSSSSYNPVTITEGRCVRSFTLTRNATSFRIYSNTQYATSQGVTTVIKNIQLETGSSASDYESYSGSTYTASLGRTIHGGKADIITGQGVDENGNSFTFNPVSINSKLGFNTMWADTGNLEVIYRSQGTAIPVPIPVPTTLIEKTIARNGTYSAEDDNADGYSEVVVDVAAQNPGKPVTLMAETSNASYTYTVQEDGRYLFVSESSGSDHTVSLPSGKSWILSSTNTNRGFFVGVADLLEDDQVVMNDSGSNYKCKWVYKVDPSIDFESVDFEETLQNPGETRKFSRGMDYDVMAIICYGCTNVNVFDYSYVDGNTCSVGYFNYGKIYIKVGKESTFARIYWNPLSSSAFYRRVDFKITINANSYPIAEEASF